MPDVHNVSPKLFTDESTPDATFREAIFSKIPREKIGWAMSVLEEWQAESDEDEYGDDDNC